MEKDNRRAQRFQKSRKFKEKHPHAKTKRGEKERNSSVINPERSVFKEIARETLAVVNQGYYEYKGNPIKILLKPYTCYGPRSSASYPSDDDRKEHTYFEVVKKSTIQACKDVYFKISNTPCALVFASAKKPGGGWLNGANAQEESIARCSALYNSARSSPMYLENINCKRTDKRGVYTDSVTYCPHVPIFRDEDGIYENEIYYADFVLCPAVNRSICQEDEEEVQKIMYERISKILGVMYAQSKRHLILGSYGCGVFGNSPETVASIFKKLLRTKFVNVFATVTFAVVDDEHYDIFYNHFPPCFEEGEMEE